MLSINEVAKELNTSWTNVNTIHQGKAWRRISNQYNIPGLWKTSNTELKLTGIELKSTIYPL